MKTKANKSLSASAFSISQLTRSPISFQRGPTVSLYLAFITDAPIEVFLVALDILGQI